MMMCMTNIPTWTLDLDSSSIILPVKDDDVSKHPMHREQLVFTPELIKTLINGIMPESYAKFIFGNASKYLFASAIAFKVSPFKA